VVRLVALRKVFNFYRLFHIYNLEVSFTTGSGRGVNVSLMGVLALIVLALIIAGCGVRTVLYG
jgi:hypothetical protein